MKRANADVRDSRLFFSQFRESHSIHPTIFSLHLVAGNCASYFRYESRDHTLSAMPSVFFDALRWRKGLLFLIFLLPFGARAQSGEIPIVTRTLAIENARVVQAPGRVIVRGTVVLRDGLILSVGKKVDIPFDAERIDGDSLVVYAGFIDGLSHAGIPKPDEPKDPPRSDDPGNPPNDVAGIQPERDARTMLDPSDKSIAALRNAGFSVVHAVPYGRMLPGAGAYVQLGGTTADAMVLRDSPALFAQFAGGRRVYPATPMGIMAKMRQLYREADRLHRLEAMYAKNPAGIERPVLSAVDQAFFPVLEGERPIFFYTKGSLEIYRALRLQHDLGFKLMLGGLSEGFDQIDGIKNADAPLFLTLDLPEAPEATAKLEADSVKALIASFNPDFRGATFRDMEAEKRNLEARQLGSRMQYLRQAADFHKAELRFGFSTIDVKPGDIHKNLRLMIENGLSEDAALAALTTDAAALLGLSATLGSIDPGKIANLVVTTAPYFEEKAVIKYVFVDGVKYGVEQNPDKQHGDKAK